MIKKIVKGDRATGRSTELLRAANDARGIFVTRGAARWKAVADKMGLKDVQVVDYSQVMNRVRRDGNRVIWGKPLYIDDMEAFIFAMTGQELEGFSIQEPIDMPVEITAMARPGRRAI